MALGNSYEGAFSATADDALTSGVNGGLRPVGEVQLAQDVADAVLGCFLLGCFLACKQAG